MRACESEDLPVVPGAPASGGSSPRGMGVWLQPLRFMYLRVRTASLLAARPPAVTTTSIEGRIS